MKNAVYGIAVKNNAGTVEHHYVSGVVFEKKGICFGVSRNINYNDKSKVFNLTDLVTGLSLNVTMPKQKDFENWEPDDEFISAIQKEHNKVKASQRLNVNIIHELRGEPIEELTKEQIEKAIKANEATNTNKE